MSKLGAMIYYEILMAWRRRSLPILWILLLAGVIGFALLVQSVNSQQPVMDGAIRHTLTAPDAPEWAQGIDLQLTTHTLALINILIAGMIFYMVSVPLLLGEVIPLDKQFKVRELLDTLPISRALYLGGKVLSTWVALLIGVVWTAPICALVLWLIFGAYDLRVFVALWIGLMVPQTLIVATLGVLCASLVGSRRSAVLVGLLVVPFALILTTTAVISFAGVGALIEPVYSLGILLPPGAETNAEIVSRMVNTLIEFVIIGGIVWTVIWGWTRVREARA